MTNTHSSPENAVTVTIIAQGDNENTPAEAIHHGLEYARKAGFIEAWSDPVAPAPENSEALELADQIEQSTGLIRMVPGEGTVQLGIRKTALVIAALRSGIPAQQMPKPLSELEGEAWQRGYQHGRAEALRAHAQSAPKPYGEVLDEMDHEAKYQTGAASVTSETLAQFLHENQPIMLGGRSQPLSVYQEFSRLILSEFNIRPKSAFTSPECGNTPEGK